MGNSLAVAKVMKIDGEIFKLKAPVKVSEAIKDYPGHVLLESKTFKRLGIRSNPLGPEEYLEGGKIYFLVELPKLPEITEKKEISVAEGSVRVKVRLRKAEVDKLMVESRDEVELAGRIVDYYVKKKAGDVGRRLAKEEMTGG